MKIVIEIPDIKYQWIKDNPLTYNNEYCEAIRKGTPLPKGHGKIVDIGKIDEDRIESDNPIIYITINGEYTEAISLDYLNELPTIIEADKEE